VAVASAGLYASLHLIPDNHPTSHHSVFFTGWMPFLPPNQQRQSTEGKQLVPLLTSNGLGKPAPEKQNHYGKTNLDLLEQETVSGCGISWAICKCKSAPRLRQITMPAPNHSFLQVDALHAAQPQRQSTEGIALILVFISFYLYFLFVNGYLSC